MFSKNHIIAAALAGGLVASASASQFFLTVPLKRAAPSISVNLQPQSIAKAIVGSAYYLDLKNFLYIKGDSSLDLSLVGWSLVGSLPEGLQFDASAGVIHGTPTSRTDNQNVIIKASYKGLSDTENYTFAALGSALGVTGGGSFGVVDAHSTTKARITLENQGDYSIGLNQPVLASTPLEAFKLGAADCGSELAAGSRCFIEVDYSAPLGEATGRLNIAASSQTPVPPVSIELNGFGRVLAAELVGSAVPDVSVNSVLEFKATLRNKGNVDLAVNSFAIEGAAYSLAENNCASTIPVGGSCEVILNFAPKSVGAHSGSLVLDTSAGVKRFEFSGTGVVSELQLSPALGNMGTAQLGSYRVSQEVTLTNNGGGAASGVQLSLADTRFALADNSCGSSLAAGASCVFKVKYTPTEVGARRTVLSAHSEGSVATMPVSATGREVSVAVALPGNGVQVWYPRVTPFNVTVTNYGSGPLALNGISIADPGTHFSVNSAGASCGKTLSAGASCTYSINAHSQLPTGWSPYTTFTVDSDAGELTTAPLRFSTLRTNITLTPSAIDFGQVDVGASAVSAAVSVKNSGNSGVVHYTLPAGVSVAESTCPASGANFPLQATCSMRFKYSPVVAGVLNATGSWTWQSGLDGTSVTFTGRATAITTPKVSNLDFSWVDVGYSEIGYATLTNPTGSAIDISSKSLTGNSEFSVVAGGSCASTLAANSSCTQAIKFTPTARGDRPAASLTMGSVPTATITGKGAVAKLAFSPAIIDFGQRQLDMDNSARPTIRTSVVNTGDPTKQLELTLPKRGATFGSSCTRVLTADAPECSIVFSANPDSVKDFIGSEYVESFSAKAGGATAYGTFKIQPVNPTASLTTPVFASAAVGSAGTKAVVTLKNTGIYRILLTKPEVTGNVNEFFLDASGSTCSSSLAVNASCTYSLSFIPTEAGARPEGQFSVSIGNDQKASVNLSAAGH